MKNKILLVDYNVGNLFNLQKAFSRVGCEVLVSSRASDILASERIVLPGVGAFSEGMNHLYKYELIDAVREFANSGRPMMGICLGLQLLFTESFENGHHEGLGLIDGSVQHIHKADHRLKVPQIGWNAISKPTENARPWTKTILEGLPEGFTSYFLHSYYVDLKNSEHALGVTQYGSLKFPSVVQKGNVMGCQFHSELSADNGLRILKNFAELKN
jgi:glutamine amidotransferase